jgi:hypothetical protein
MYAQKFSTACRPRRLDDAAALLPVSRDRLHDLGALNTLRMAGWRPMVCKPFAMDQDERHVTGA